MVAVRLRHTLACRYLYLATYTVADGRRFSVPRLAVVTRRGRALAPVVPLSLYTVRIGHGARPRIAKETGRNLDVATAERKLRVAVAGTHPRRAVLLACRGLLALAQA